MATFVFWRDVVPAAMGPFDDITRYTYDTSDDSITSDFFTVPAGTLGPIHPPVGTIMYQECNGLDMNQYKSTGSQFSVNKFVLTDAPGCCTLAASDFSVVRTNNTSLLTPNGTITITAPVLDIGDYEASINGGVDYFTQVDDEIVFEDLPAGNYEVIIKAISGVCSVTINISVNDQITYPPLIIAEETLPALYAPIFWPITLGFKLVNNQGAVKQDGGGTYIEVTTQDGKDYLATLPIIKIFDTTYAGTYQVLSVDDPDNPAKFYIDAVYTIDFFTFENIRTPPALLIDPGNIKIVVRGADLVCTL